MKKIIKTMLHNRIIKNLICFICLYIGNSAITHSCILSAYEPEFPKELL